MNKVFTAFLFLLLLSKNVMPQGFPWENPLKIAWSSDGINFNPPVIFQDSSGVPSVVRWKGDTLVCAFQWFRQPNGSPTWDRVAVKFSYDNGINWTTPAPITVNGLPVNYQRPFDPTLLPLNADSIRIYYSSSDGIPNGLDSTVNTYSAISTDGVNYSFEPMPRVDEPNSRVIDPAVIHFHSIFHYLAPIGSPQQGAYHYISQNGINFTKVQDIPSDSSHNWTGNYMVNDTGELRFYGAGRNGIWYNSTPNGGVWNGFINTNLHGGDPSAVKIGTNNYLIIFVGAPYTTGIDIIGKDKIEFSIFPNPSAGNFTFEVNNALIGETIIIFDIAGKEIYRSEITNNKIRVDISNFASEMYFVKVKDKSRLIKIEKE